MTETIDTMLKQARRERHDGAEARRRGEQLTNEEVRQRRRREHFEKYDALAKQLGLGQLIDKVYHLKFQVEKALRDGDHHLNTIPLRSWDYLAGVEPTQFDHRVGDVKHEGVWRGQQRLSIAQRVCVLKHVARHYVAEED